MRLAIDLIPLRLAQLSEKARAGGGFTRADRLLLLAWAAYDIDESLKSVVALSSHKFLIAHRDRSRNSKTVP